MRTGIPRPRDMSAVLRATRGVIGKATQTKRLPIALVASPSAGSLAAPSREHEPSVAPALEKCGSATSGQSHTSWGGTRTAKAGRSNLPAMPVPECKRTRASGAVAKEVAKYRVMLEAAVGELSAKFYAASNQKSVAAKRRLMLDLATSVAAHANLRPFPKAF